MKDRILALRNFKNWDEGSKQILYIWIALFFVGLALGYFLSFFVQCVVVAVLYVIISYRFYRSEYGHTGIMTGVWLSTLVLSSLISAIIIVDIILLFF